MLPPPLCCSQLCEPEEPTFPSCHYSCSLNCGGGERGTRILPPMPLGDRLGVHLLIYQAALLKRSMVQAGTSGKACEWVSLGKGGGVCCAVCERSFPLLSALCSLDVGKQPLVPNPLCCHPSLPLTTHQRYCSMATSSFVWMLFSCQVLQPCSPIQLSS